MDYIGAVGTGHGSSYHYFPDPGPPWFVAWLLLFSGSFAALRGPPLAAPPRPPLRRLLLWGGGLGLLQGVLMVLIPGGDFAFMPLTLGSLPFDVAFFCAGIAARRGAWLETPLTPAELGLAWRVSTVFGTAVFGATIANYVWLQATPAGASEPPPPLYPSPAFPYPNCNLADDGPASVCGAVSLAWTLGLLGGAAGVFCAGWCALLLDLFRRRCNGPRSRLATELGASAYAVYLLHPLVVVPLTVGYAALLRDALGVPVVFNPGHASASHVGEPALWAGWAALTAAALAISWTLGAVVRRLPGCRAVL